MNNMSNSGTNEKINLLIIIIIIINLHGLETGSATSLEKHSDGNHAQGDIPAAHLE